MTTWCFEDLPRSENVVPFSSRMNLFHAGTQMNDALHRAIA